MNVAMKLAPPPLTQPSPNLQVCQVSAQQPVQTELLMRHHQLQSRLATLKIENEEVRATSRQAGFENAANWVFLPSYVRVSIVSLSSQRPSNVFRRTRKLFTRRTSISRADDSSAGEMNDFVNILGKYSM